MLFLGANPQLLTNTEMTRLRSSRSKLQYRIRTMPGLGDGIRCKPVNDLKNTSIFIQKEDIDWIIHGKSMNPVTGLKQ